MRLSDYLEHNEMSAAAFAKKVGVSSEAVRLWIEGERMPRYEMLMRIERITAGSVTANDFVKHRKAS